MTESGMSEQDRTVDTEKAAVETAGTDTAAEEAADAASGAVTADREETAADETADSKETAAGETADSEGEGTAAGEDAPESAGGSSEEPASEETAEEPVSEKTEEPVPETAKEPAEDTEDIPEKPKFIIPAVILLAGIALILYAYLFAGRGAVSPEPPSAAPDQSASAGSEASAEEEYTAEEAAKEADRAAEQETAEAEETKETAEETDAEPAVPLAEQYRWLTVNEDLFPARKVEQAEGNRGLTEFLYRYGHGETSADHVSPALLNESDLADTRMRSYPKQIVQLEVPYLRQWDERWGFYPYGSSVIGLTGCGPTCLSMAIASLADAAVSDSSAEDTIEIVSPDVLAAFAEENGYYMDGTGTRWSLFTEGAKEFGVECRVLPALLESIQQEINAGHPVIFSMGPGDFTYSGHFILVTGYAADRLVIHDPNSEKISDRLWRFQDIRPQIVNIWSCMPCEPAE